MEDKKVTLIKTIAILLSVTPQTPLGKFLRLCLETKVDLEIAGETPLEVAQEFVDRPSSLPDWAERVICADGEVKDEEWQAMEELGIDNLDEFLIAFWTELEKIDL